MTFSKHLFDLQDLDSSIIAKVNSVANIIDTINNNKMLDTAKSKLVSAQALFTKQKTNQRELELTLDDIKTKANKTEEKLYSGTLTNPRELSGFQEEHRLLISRQHREEDILLDVLIAVEEAESILSNSKEIFEKIDLAKKREIKKLTEEKHLHQKEIDELRIRQQAIKVKIEDKYLSLYENLRKSKHGTAVVTMDRNICRGCRIEIPNKIIQQLKEDSGLIQCNSCGRILHLS